MGRYNDELETIRVDIRETLCVSAVGVNGRFTAVFTLRAFTLFHGQRFFVSAVYRDKSYQRRVVFDVIVPDVLWG